MQQFVFVGSQGSFTVPSGESRIGSDAACQICIRGDGVLPVHAYVRSDGDRVLIRPADAGSSSSGYTGGLITVNGQVLSGPVMLEGGQEIAIGSIHMRLQTNGVKKASLPRRLWQKTWFKVGTYVFGTFALLLLLAYSILMFVILDESALKNQISTAISTYLLRDDTEIESIQVKPFDGLVSIKNIKLKDREGVSASHGPFVTVPAATLQFKVWPWLTSWFKEYRDLEIVFHNPELNLERTKNDGALNIRDILKKYSQAGSAIDLNVHKLNASLEIRNGRVRMRDEYTNIGETSLEDINIRLVLPAQGEPVVIEQCEMNVNSIPAPLAKGALRGTGKLMVVDAACVIDSRLISSNDLRLDMKYFDLARIFEHLGYAWEPAIADFKGKVMLGKPINGHLELKIKDLNNVRIGGAVASESLLSIREENRPAIGSSPMGLNFDVLLKDNGSGYRPHDMNIRLRSGYDLGKPETTHLNFGAVGKLNPGGTSTYIVDFECILQDFFGTEVGRRLGLEGRLGGRLTGKAHLVREASGTWKIDVNGALPKEAYVMVSDPQKPNEMSRQSLPLNFEYHASAQPSADGSISELNVDTFHIRAPSFEASSQVPGVVRSTKGELETQAQFKLNLKGREFWIEFSPILALFGFTQPIEEILDLKVTLVGKNDLVSVAAVGTASRQWKNDPAKEVDPAPVQLRTVIDFNRKATIGKPQPNAPPWLSLVLEIISTEGKPMFVHLDALCTRDEKHETLSASLAAFDKEKNAQLPGIKSDIVTLRDRLQPYIEGYLRKLDAGARKPNGSWLKHYRETVLKGELEQSGKLTIKRPVDPKLPLPDVFDFDFNIAGKNLDIRMPLRLSEEPNAAPATWNWNEQNVNMKIKGVLALRQAENKEEPDTRKLDLEMLNVHGSLGAFEVTARDLDFFKLQNIRRLPNVTWTDCVANLTMSGNVEPPAYELARSLSILPPENPICGSVAMKLAFDRKKDELMLEKLQFKQTEKKPISFLLNADAAGSLLRVRDLSARLFSTAEDAAPFAEQLEAILEDGGPAALLDHLGDELALNSLQIDTAALLEWLRQNYGAKPGARQPPASIAGLLNGDWKPEGIWKAAGVRFSRNDPKYRKWTLVGAFRNDFTAFAEKSTAPASVAPGQENKPQPARAAAFSFAHEWALRMGVAMSQNDGNVLALDVDEVILDKAKITASIPQLNYVYEKPAGEACKLELAQCLYSHGTLAQIGRMKLIGKPVPIDIKDFDASFARGGTNLQIGEALINGGPLPCALTNLKFDQANDKMQVRLNAPTADLGYVTSLFPRIPAGLKLSGGLKNVGFTYKGSIVGLRAVLDANPTEMAKRLKIEKDDPRLAGLNPESDALDFSAACADTRLLASASSGEALDAKLAGNFRLTTRDLAWKEFSAALEHRTPNTSVKQAFSSPNLQINTTDAKLTLIGALKAAGLPVNISSDLTFSTPVEPAALLASSDLFTASLTNAVLPKLSDERKLSALEQLVFTGSVSAPALVLQEMTLTSVETRDLSLKGLKLSLPLLVTNFYGGKLELSDIDFDLTKSSAVHAGGRLGVKGAGFRLRLRVTDSDVSQMLGCTAKSGYIASGKLSAQGALSSGNFATTDRHTWEGAVKLSIANPSFAAPLSPENASDAAPLWMANFKTLGGAFFKSFVNAACSETITTAEMAQSLPVGEGQKALNGFGIALQAYLAKAFGAEFTRLDFETLQPTIEIRSGLASLNALQLTGRGPSSGLDLQLKNLKINLADEAFAEELIVFPTSLPAAARERMSVDRWPAAEQQEYLRDIENKLPLRISGRPAAATLKLPWGNLKNVTMRALFGAERITDLAALELARQHLTKTFAPQPSDRELPALLADRAGIGLPGTLTARLTGQTLIDRVPNLPPHLLEQLSATGPVITPLESINLLLKVEEPKDPKLKPPAPQKPEPK
ncbi:MAG TPA: FHA domain-containing protein [Planctomycetota bacterium]|nr:FHA domain-containing protein [Planctomycetota bacterium]